MAARKTRSRIQATTLSEKQLQGWIADLAAPRSDSNTKSGRFGKLHELVRIREQHFHAAEEADPVLEYPHDQVAGFQSDLPRRTWVDMKARLVENPFRFRVTPPRDTPKQRQKADDFEKVLNLGFMALQKRHNIWLQSDLGDGQIVDCYGILHWQKATDIWPKFPDGNVLDSMPDPEDAGDYTEGEDGKYYETETSKQERDKRAKAKAGFPWYVEVIHPSMFSFVEDRSCANGMAAALVLRTVPLLEYADKLRQTDKIHLSLNAQDNRIHIYEERERPADNDPSVAGETAWDTKVYKAEFWTRDEYYELVSSGGGGKAPANWVLVKSFKHPYEMPPFALAEADHFNTPDPAYKYRPALDGIFRIKPFYDRDITLGRAIAEQTALPLYYIKQSDGSYMVGEDGKQLTLTKNALAAMTLPPGAEIVTVAPEMGDAFIQFLKVTGEEMQEAAPETGSVEVGASTAPWTIRLAQDQANVYVKQLKIAQARALEAMGQNVLLVAQKPASDGGIGQPMWMYDEDGKLIGLDPNELNGMEIAVDINPTSNAQQIAQIEHGRTLLADENVPLTQEQFLEEYMGEENVTERIEAYTAEQVYRTKFREAVIDQKLAEQFGKLFFIAPGGVPVGMGGEPLTPEDALMRKGIKVQQPGMGAPVQAPMAPPPPTQMGGGMQGIAQPTVDPLSAAPMNGPGVAPISGIPGVGATV